MLKIKLKLNPSKIKLPNRFFGKSHAFICFRSDEEKETALKLLDGYKWKGKTLSAKAAEAVVDPMLKKRLENANENQSSSERKKTCLEATAPLANVPYADQVQQKEQECFEQLRAYAEVVKKANYRLKGTISKNQEQFNGLPCQWLGFRGSPVTNGYRNKNELAIGKNANGDKIVGFRLGSYLDGSVEVAAIDDLPHVPERTKLAARLFQQYIQSSKYDVFSPEFYSGQFRQLGVRVSTSTNEVMLIIGIHTTV